ncbi:MAG TPA: sodium-dependent transporter [Firmicutes bacterium]|nr:sodium-dependent transporter [Bacillota bacterium]
MSLAHKNVVTSSTETRNVTVKDGFGSKFGVIAAAAGSAIGLGNVWRFPYITGANGGAAFLMVYIGCVVLIGLVVMLAEFVIGRRSEANAVGSFKKLAPNTPWFLTGWMGLITSVLIFSFYSCVAGWCLHYLLLSLTNAFAGATPGEIGDMFGSFITSYNPIVYQVIIIALTGGIVLLGVKNGIEKASKILMPLLFVILLVLGIRSLTLPNAMDGVSFLFKPDFSALTADSIFTALGHAFFTLSLGMGVMITYGSYIGKSDNLGSTAVAISIADTVVALLAGLAVFPAVFSFNLEPTQGPGLVFSTLPNVFNHIPFGNLFGGLFFALLAIAAITSTISLLEVIVAYLEQELNLTRKKATLLSTGTILVTGALCALSNTPLLSNVLVFGNTFFDFADNVTANYLMPIGGLIIVLFIGWGMKKEDVESELLVDGAKPWYSNVFIFLAKFVTPVLIAVVFLNQLGILG